MLTVEQKSALEKVAQALGWDCMSVAEVAILAWAAFHYYVERLRNADQQEPD